MVSVVTTPNASGVSNRANTMLLIGVKSLDTIAVTDDHFAALATLPSFSTISTSTIYKYSLINQLIVIEKRTDPLLLNLFHER